MKTIIIDGRLGKDAEIRTTARGTNYIRFSLANDVYSNGESVTEWFDIYSFDSFIIEKKTEILKKGRYVIVTGTPKFDVNAKNGQIYKNLSVMATSIDTPSFGSGRKEQDGSEASVINGGASVYSVKPQAQPQQFPQQMRPQPTVAPQTQPSYQPQPQANPVYNNQFAPNVATQRYGAPAGSSADVNTVPKPQVISQMPQPTPQPQVAPQPQVRPQVAPQPQAVPQPTVTSQPNYTPNNGSFLEVDDDELPF